MRAIEERLKAIDPADRSISEKVDYLAVKAQVAA